MALVGGRKLSPIVGRPCETCHRPTGSVDKMWCASCEQDRRDMRLLRDIALAPADTQRLLWGVLASQPDIGPGGASRLYPDGAPEDAA